MEKKLLLNYLYNPFDLTFYSAGKKYFDQNIILNNGSEVGKIGKYFLYDISFSLNEIIQGALDLISKR